MTKFSRNEINIAKIMLTINKKQIQKFAPIVANKNRRRANKVTQSGLTKKIKDE